MPAIDVQKAIEKIQGFGYSVGYLQTATFIIGELKPAPGREFIRMIPVTVYELEKLGAHDTTQDFETNLATLADIPIPSPVPVRNNTPQAESVRTGA